MTTTWQHEYESKRSPSLEGDIEADVTIVGGGLAGITAAYLLAKEGKNVVVLEKKTLVESVTAYTTAFLTCEIDTAYSDLISVFGTDTARAIWQSGSDAIDQVEVIIKEEGIDCEFTRCPSYLFARTPRRARALIDDVKAAQDAGFHFEKVTNLPVGAEAYLLPNQAKFHPLKYADGLRKAAERYGARFYERTEALDIRGTTRVIVTTTAGQVLSGWAIIATYNPFNKPKELFGKKGMYLSYVYELEIPSSLLPEGLYIDSDNPYHYFRIDKGRGQDRMIIGGEDHRKELKLNPERNFRALREYTQKILGTMTYAVRTRWSGPILETWDGLPFIGAYSDKQPHILVATGFSGNGMTYAMTAAQILRSTILGKKSVYSHIFSPNRSYSLKAAIIKGRDYIGALFGGVLHNLFKSKKHMTSKL